MLSEYLALATLLLSACLSRRARKAGTTTTYKVALAVAAVGWCAMSGALLSSAFRLRPSQHLDRYMELVSAGLTVLFGAAEVFALLRFEAIPMSRWADRGEA